MSWLSVLKNDIVTLITGHPNQAVNTAVNQIATGAEALTTQLDNLAETTVENAINAFAGPAVAALSQPILEAIQAYVTTKLTALEASAASTITKTS